MQTKRKSSDQLMIIPPKGNNEDLFQRLSNYIGNFDPEWISRIQPASQESIDLFRRISGIENFIGGFPECYQVFLQHMGANDGGLLSKSILFGTSSIDEMIEVYQSFHQDEPGVLNAPYLSFFQRDMATGELSFDLQKDHHLKIVDTYMGEFDSFHAESFEYFLFQCAFNSFRRYGNYCFSFGNSGNTMDQFLSTQQEKNASPLIEGFFEKYNFEKMWFSDRKNFIAERGDIAISIAYQQAICGIIIGNDRQQLEQLAKDLTEKLGVTIQRELYYNSKGE